MPEYNPNKIKPSKRLPPGASFILSSFGTVMKTRKNQHLQYVQVEREGLLTELSNIIDQDTDMAYRMVTEVVTHAIEDWGLEKETFNPKINRHKRHNFNTKDNDYPNQFTMASLIDGILKHNGSNFKTRAGLTSHTDLIYLCDYSGLTSLIEQAVYDYYNSSNSELDDESDLDSENRED
jgi:hypothetical protein